MKKNLIVALALVFVLGIAGTAFAAANPFTDVPAKHWAYDAVAKLAQAGILDGYGDGTYRGERTATRYELAQATAKAMARSDKADAQMKALIDKLAVEFAAELNNLGVRVAKLEKNASSIKWGGDSRLRLISNQASYFNFSGTTANANWDERLRLYASATVNDNTAFYGRIMTNWRENSIAGTTGASNAGNSYEAATYWDYGYFEWTQSPSFKVAVGRQQITGSFNLMWTNGGYDAIQFKFGAPADAFNAKIGYGDLGTYNGAAGNPTATGATKPVLFVDANYKLNKDWAVNGSVYYVTNSDKMTSIVATPGDSQLAGTSIGGSTVYYNGIPFQVYGLALKGNLNPDWIFEAHYLWNGASIGNVITAPGPTGASTSGLGLNDSKNAWFAALQYKMADPLKVGTWDARLQYRDVKPFAVDLGNTSGLMGNDMQTTNNYLYGMKGWSLDIDYTFSKNAVLSLTYQAMSANNTNNWMLAGQNMNNQQYLPVWYLQANINF